jgi:hypothetical protein
MEEVTQLSDLDLLDDTPQPPLFSSYTPQSQPPYQPPSSQPQPPYTPYNQTDDQPPYTPYQQTEYFDPVPPSSPADNNTYPPIELPAVFSPSNPPSNSSNSSNSSSTPPTEILGEKVNPLIYIGNEPFDRDSAIGIVIVLYVWIYIWYATGLRKTLLYDGTFFIIFWIFSLYMLFSIITSDITSGGVIYELNILFTTEQSIAILLGSTIVFMLFHDKIGTHPNCRPIITKLSLSIFMLLVSSSLWITAYSTGRMFRFLRKIKQGFYNMALVLFLIIGIIFIKGNVCPMPLSAETKTK